MSESKVRKNDSYRMPLPGGVVARVVLPKAATDKQRALIADWIEAVVMPDLRGGK